MWLLGRHGEAETTGREKCGNQGIRNRAGRLSVPAW
jgi:hypothetical protein